MVHGPYRLASVDAAQHRVSPLTLGPHHVDPRQDLRPLAARDTHRSQAGRTGTPTRGTRHVRRGRFGRARHRRALLGSPARARARTQASRPHAMSTRGRSRLGVRGHVDTIRVEHREGRAGPERRGEPRVDRACDIPVRSGAAATGPRWCRAPARSGSRAVGRGEHDGLTAVPGHRGGHTCVPGIHRRGAHGGAVLGARHLLLGRRDRCRVCAVGHEGIGCGSPASDARPGGRTARRHRPSRRPAPGSR